MAMAMLHAAAGSYSDDDGDRDGDGGVSVHVPTTDFIGPTKKPRIKTTSVVPVLPVPTHPLSLSATTAALSSPTPRAVPLTSATEGRAGDTTQPTAPRDHTTHNADGSGATVSDGGKTIQTTAVDGTVMPTHMRTTTTPYQNDYECADRCSYGRVIHRSTPMNRAGAGITPPGHAGGDECTVSNKINVALAMMLQVEMTRSLLSTWMEANLME
jgi:hypothetical protein